jgi:dihydroflavonol-4-reductase
MSSAPDFQQSGSSRLSARPRTLVTGANGYIARHVIRLLLEAGHDVVGTVRTPALEPEVRRALMAASPAAGDLERLRLVPLTLDADEGWAVAMQGAAAVIHIAAPFPPAAPRKYETLGAPTVGGTLRVLRHVVTLGVPRMVLTSSLVAAAFPRNGQSGRPITESDWTDDSDPDLPPYVLAKTRAESAAWKEVASRPSRTRLTTILPGLVVGTPIGDHLGTSMQTLARIVDGKDSMLPRFGFPVVDVRDVASAHVRCIDSPATFGQRVIVADRFMWIQEIAEQLHAMNPGRVKAAKVAPSGLIRFLALFDGRARSIAHQLDRRLDAPGQFARSTLGLPSISAHDAIVQAAQYLFKIRGVA